MGRPSGSLPTINKMFLEYSNATKWQLSEEVVELLFSKNKRLTENQKRFFGEIFAELRKVFEHCMEETTEKSYLEMVEDLKKIAEKVEQSNLISIKLEKWHTFYEKNIRGYVLILKLFNLMEDCIFPEFEVLNQEYSYNGKTITTEEVLQDIILGGIIQIAGHLMFYAYPEEKEILERRKWGVR